MEPVRADHEAQLEPENAWAKRVASNLGALSIARGVTALLSLALAAYLARALGPESYGIIGFAAAIFSYLLLFSRLGYDVVGTRELAREHSQAASYAGTVISVRLLLAIVGYATYALLVVVFLNKGSTVTNVLLVYGLAVFAHAISLDWAYQGVERMGIIAVRIVGTSAVHLLFVVLLVHNPEDVLLAVIIYVGSLFLLNGLLLVAFAKGFGLPHFRGSLHRARGLLPAALPVASSAFMTGVFYNVDLIMLGLLRSEYEVGLYSVCVRALTAAIILAMIASQAYFPSLASVLDETTLMRQRSKSFARVILPIGIPACVAASLLAKPLIVFFAGNEYAEATNAFALLMINAALVYASSVFGRPLLAWNKERAYMAIVGVAALTDIILNYIMIPHLGIIGSATATVLSQLIVLAGFMYVHYQLVHQLYMPTLAKTLLATSVSVVVPIFLLQSTQLHVLVTLSITCLCYILVAVLLGLFSKKQLLQVLSRNT